jgi:tubulin polyglutamylase TTLL6/13
MSMCFELLGFDIMITEQMQPILLEVNHAPSFATDSPLDYHVKKNLFLDVFTLLGMTLDRKKQKLRQIQEEKQQRIYNKLSSKQRAEKQQILQQTLI